MKRMAMTFLQTWIKSADRKPLIIRGARQVGKTWLVRHFAEISKLQLIEINFEKQPNQASLFSSNNPKQILLNLSTVINRTIDPNESLLFLDELQTAPEILGKLRWFAEELPALAVIGAGSLLEFTLGSAAFSVPVGRISYMHLEPFSFEEFLLANNKNALLEYLTVFDFKSEIPALIHDQLTTLFKEYVIVGGLPAVILNWINEHSLGRINQIQHDLLAAYRDDFAKYRGRIAIEKLDEVMMAVPKMLGQKFVFSKVNSSIQTNTIKQVLDLLQKARLCHRVSGCSANGVPLAAEIKEKVFKEIFLDVGLCCVALGLNLTQINAATEISLINNGGVAEQVVGQLLRTIVPFYVEPALYYWHREEKGSNAEVDYIIQFGNKVVPVEVKAGSTGSLKSLHLFMGLKKYSTAVRINSDKPSIAAIDVKDSKSVAVKYKLLSIPFYLLGQLNRLLELEMAENDLKNIRGILPSANTTNIRDRKDRL